MIQTIIILKCTINQELVLPVQSCKTMPCAESLQGDRQDILRAKSSNVSNDPFLITNKNKLTKFLKLPVESSMV